LGIPVDATENGGQRVMELAAGMEELASTPSRHCLLSWIEIFDKIK
jgi:hypothetical protein